MIRYADSREYEVLRMIKLSDVVCIRKGEIITVGKDKDGNNIQEDKETKKEYNTGEQINEASGKKKMNQSRGLMNFFRRLSYI